MTTSNNLRPNFITYISAARDYKLDCIDVTYRDRRTGTRIVRYFDAQQTIEQYIDATAETLGLSDAEKDHDNPETWIAATSRADALGYARGIILHDSPTFYQTPVDASCRTDNDNDFPRLRRIDLTHDGRTERLYACRGDDPGWWILYAADEWKDCEDSSWELFEGDDGEEIYFQGQPPVSGASWKWIDSAPTAEAEEEAARNYETALRYRSTPDD